MSTWTSYVKIPSRQIRPTESESYVHNVAAKNNNTIPEFLLKTKAYAFPANVEFLDLKAEIAKTKVVATLPTNIKSLLSAISIFGHPDSEPPSKETLSMLWISLDDRRIAVSAKILDFFSRHFPITQKFDEFLRRYTARVETLKKDIDQEFETAEKIAKIKPVPYTKFIQRGVKAKYHLETLSDQTSDLYDIFNDFSVSAGHIPYMHLYDGKTGDTYYKAIDKVYEIPNSIKWKDAAPKFAAGSSRRKSTKSNDGKSTVTYIVFYQKVDTLNADNQYEPGYLLKVDNKPAADGTADSTADRARSSYIELTIDVTTALGSSAPNALDKFLGRFDTIKFKSIVDIKKTEHILSVKGTFAVPNYTLGDYSIFLHIISCNPLYNKYFYADEMEQMTRNKRSKYFLYTSAAGNPLADVSEDSGDAAESGKISFILSKKAVNPIDYSTFVIAGTGEKVELYTEYINVHIHSATDIRTVEYFQTVFAKLIYSFSDEWKKIKKEYTDILEGGELDEFNNSNKQCKITKIPKLKDFDVLKIANPELFGDRYSTSCQPVARHPKLVEDISDIDAKKQNGHLKVKSTGDLAIKYPDTEEGLYYKCSNKKYPYPYLIENKTEGATYSGFPCCSVDDQINKNTKSKSDKAATVKSKGYSYAIEKIMNVGDRGLLPKNVFKTMVTVFGKKDYYREGGSVTRYSFLSCVLKAVLGDRFIDDIKIGVKPTKGAKKVTTDTLQYLQTTMIPKINMGTFSESNPATNIDHITGILNAETIDSKQFATLFENVFGIKIVVFHKSKDGDLEASFEADSNGSIEIPDHTFGFVFRPVKPDVPVVAVYKHYGGTADGRITPHYELILHRHTAHYENKFIPTQEVADNINNLYNSAYQLSVIGRSARFEIDEFKTRIEGAVFDSAGKCRGLKFSGKERPVSLYFYEPVLLPGSAGGYLESRNCRGVIGADGNDDSIPPKAEVDEFIKAENLEAEVYDVSPDPAKPKLIGYKVRLGASATCGYLPFQGVPATTKHLKAAAQFVAPFYVSKENVLDTTARNRRIAMFLQQFIVYHFVSKMKEAYDNLYKILEADLEAANLSKKVEKPELKDSKVMQAYDKFEESLQTVLVDEYFRKFVAVDPKHSYGDISNVPRCFSCNTVFFSGTKTRKLMLTSENIKKRLQNFVEILVKNHVHLFSAVPKQIEGYFSTVDDFKKVPGQVVFAGTKSFENWLNSVGKANSRATATTEFVPRTGTSQTPYFLKNWTLGQATLLVQPTEAKTLESALNVSRRFYEDGVNYGYDMPKDIAESPAPAYYYQCEFLGGGFIVKKVQTSSGGAEIVKEIKSDLPAVLKIEGDKEFCGVVVV